MREHIGLERVVVADVVDVPRHAYSMNDLIAQHLPLEPLSDITPEEDLALLPYTGGTTGVPKGAMLTHANLVANAIQFSRWFDYRPGEETFIAVLPLSHIGGIAGVMSVPIAVGGTIILFRRFHPQGVFQAIEGYRATRFSWRSDHVHQPSGPTRFRAIRSVVLGAQPHQCCPLA